MTHFLPDTPSNEDAFGRKSFAEHLARAVQLPKGSPGIVIGIEGEWGSGKTTVINLLKSSMTSPDSVIVVEFNPWQISGSPALVEALLMQLASAVGQDSASQSAKRGLKAGQQILRYAGLLKHLKYLKYVPALGWAGHVAEDLGDLAENFGKATDSVTKDGKEALSTLEELLPKYDLPKLKSDVIHAITALNRPILVIVDDLDRLPNEEIRAVIQAIKAVADFPRTTYLLAYDRPILANALSNGSVVSKNYLDKIVQISYPIPLLLGWQLRDYMDTRLTDLMGRLRLKLKRYEREKFPRAIKLAANLCRHPRDVNRLVNRLTVSLGATAGEVNLCDVVVFEAISQMWPSFRDQVVRFPARFTGMPINEPDDGSEEDWSQFLEEREDAKGDTWKEKLSEDADLRNAIIASCEFLFPRLRKGQSSREHYIDQLRVADNSRLVRLLALTAIGDVPDATPLHNLLKNPRQLFAALDANDPSSKGLVHWLNHYSGSSEGVDVKKCSAVLVDFANQCLAGNSLTKDLVQDLSQLLLTVIPMEEMAMRKSVVAAIANKAPLSLSHDVVLEAVTDQGKWKLRPTEKKRLSAQLISDGPFVDELTVKWCERVQAKMQSAEFLNEPKLHAILFRWLQFGGSYKEILAAIRSLCQTSAGLNRYLEYFDRQENVDNLGHYQLVWDANELAELIRSAGLTAKYDGLLGTLRSEELLAYLDEQKKLET